MSGCLSIRSSQRFSMVNVLLVTFLFSWNICLFLRIPKQNPSNSLSQTTQSSGGNVTPLKGLTRGILWGIFDLRNLWVLWLMSYQTFWTQLKIAISWESRLPASRIKGQQGLEGQAGYNNDLWSNPVGGYRISFAGGKLGVRNQQHNNTGVLQHPNLTLSCKTVSFGALSPTTHSQELKFKKAALHAQKI